MSSESRPGEDPNPSITEHATEGNAWFAEHKVSEIRELATAFRIPNGPVVNGADATAVDHHVARDFFTTNPRDGFVRPGPPYRTHPDILRRTRHAPRLGEHTEHHRPHDIPRRQTGDGSADPLPFRGPRVLGMTTFWAGPSCTHLLAMLCAEAVHVESAGRPDGTRLVAGVLVTEDR